MRENWRTTLCGLLTYAFAAYLIVTGHVAEGAALLPVAQCGLLAQDAAKTTPKADAP